MKKGFAFTVDLTPILQAATAAGSEAEKDRIIRESAQQIARRVFGDTAVDQAQQSGLDRVVTEALNSDQPGPLANLAQRFDTLACQQACLTAKHLMVRKFLSKDGSVFFFNHLIHPGDHCCGCVARQEQELALLFGLQAAEDTENNGGMFRIEFGPDGNAAFENMVSELQQVDPVTGADIGIPISVTVIGGPDFERVKRERLQRAH